jgi:hypothetical protein
VKRPDSTQTATREKMRSRRRRRRRRRRGRRRRSRRRRRRKRRRRNDRYLQLVLYFVWHCNHTLYTRRGFRFLPILFSQHIPPYVTPEFFCFYPLRKKKKILI